MKTITECAQVERQSKYLCACITANHTHAINWHLIFIALWRLRVFDLMMQPIRKSVIPLSIFLRACDTISILFQTNTYWWEIWTYNIQSNVTFILYHTIYHIWKHKVIICNHFKFTRLNKNSWINFCMFVIYGVVALS